MQRDKLLLLVTFLGLKLV